ncbi:MAG: hypothetical protein DSY57_05810 [Desulfobulbus sp.]|nr:MAG: hypothetical protein DSY57_05810 [Desulfobulbus sp.]
MPERLKVTPLTNKIYPDQRGKKVYGCSDENQGNLFQANTHEQMQSRRPPHPHQGNERVHKSLFSDIVRHDTMTRQLMVNRKNSMPAPKITRLNGAWDTYPVMGGNCR